MSSPEAEENSDQTNVIPFSFSSFSKNFEEHIHHSIRGYHDLRDDCIRLSQYFIESDSQVLDIGCSTGKLLRRIRDANKERIRRVRYLGIDIEPAFQEQWTDHEAEDIAFEIRDARNLENLQNVSLVTSLFTLQFIPDKDRPKVISKVYDILADGGAFIIAEKVNAGSARFQDMLASIYYDHKMQNFSEEEIFAKERSLRSKLKSWTLDRVVMTLLTCGFKPDNLQPFWQNHLFVSILAVK